jgi:N-acetylglucosaminyl-diphospho-decaprenol L-rhamnosyltransferase
VVMLQADFSWVRLIKNSVNVGFATANNQAIGQSSGRYVLLLNSDTKVLPGGLAELVDFMKSQPHAGAAGSRLLNPDGTLQPSCSPEPTLARELWRLFHLDSFYPCALYRMHDWPVDRPRRADIVQGASMILRRAVIDQVGVLDTDYFMYSEEVDLCHRVLKAGWQIYWVPASQIIHYGGQSTKQAAAAMFLQLYRGKTLYFRKNHGQMAATAYKGILAAATLARLCASPLTRFTPTDKRAEQATLTSHYRLLLHSLPSL